MTSWRVVNASPLIFLTRVGLLDVLRETGVEALVPDAVVAEILACGPANETVQMLDRARWMKVEPSRPIPAPIQAWSLGPGESAVLALALALPGSEVILDDQEARRCARSLAIPVQGTLGLVIVAKRLGLIPAARPVIEKLRRSGMYLSERVLDQALALAGE